MGGEEDYVDTLSDAAAESEHKLRCKPVLILLFCQQRFCAFPHAAICPNFARARGCFLSLSFPLSRSLFTLSLGLFISLSVYQLCRVLDLSQAQIKDAIRD